MKYTDSNNGDELKDIKLLLRNYIFIYKEIVF